MELQIHLRHRFLHVLDMRGGVFDQHLTVSQVAAQRRNLAGWRNEAGNNP